LNIPQDLNPLTAWLNALQDDLLAKLAILVLSLVCNSADTAWFFSVTGDTKDPSCNRLSVEKMVMASTIKLELNHWHALQGTYWKCMRRSFGLASSDRDHVMEMGFPHLDSYGLAYSPIHMICMAFADN
jgi:hypothetical protein